MTGIALENRYQIEHPVGQGGMGRVFAATDLQLNRRVAIKLVRDELNDPVTNQRFRREALAAAAVNHPNICRLYEIGEHDGKPFLVMELLDGESLSSRLKRGPMDVTEIADVMLPLMDAVVALHNTGLIHRDLKPSNVFLTEHGVRLLDFGLARQTQGDATMTMATLTAPGGVTGTLRYMAPEQVTGDPLDERTDVFALGVMIFEIVSGHVPFAAETNSDWLNAVLTQDPPPLYRSDVPALGAIVNRALQRRPDDRYDTVTEMREAMAEALGVPRTAQAAPALRAEAADVPDRVVRLAVLPFRLLQPDDRVAFLEAGIPEQLTAALAHHSQVRVVASREGGRFGEATELTTIARELSVESVVTGTVLAGADQVRVTTQLVGDDGGVRWSTTHEQTIADPLAMQDAICAAILRDLPVSTEPTDPDATVAR
jgi:TolB-like protein/tRNA A-37 threonylcarbamoyl transferase component Bud32